MRKNRNAFFSESNMNFQGYNPMVANMPYQNMSSNNAFYAGNMPINPGLDLNEIPERLAKIERQINRIEHRLSKLENNNVQSTDDYDSTTNNMYII